MKNRLQAIDDYVARAKPFAQPILAHLRNAIHRTVPEIEEQMKWSQPFFVYRGVILGNMAAFKEHCSFRFWGEDMARVLREDGVVRAEGMGSFGRITGLDDLPPTPDLERYLRHAAELIGSGTRLKSIQRVRKEPRPETALPEPLALALEQRPEVGEAFRRLSPSCRREYAEWIAEAKREETRDRRLATALAQIAEGKGLNAKYEQRG